MMINSISNVNILPPPSKNTLNTTKKISAPLTTNPIENVKPQINSDSGALKSYFLAGVNFGGKKKPDPIKNYVNNLPFADELSPEDKRNLGNVLRKNDEETDYMKK